MGIVRGPLFKLRSWCGGRPTISSFGEDKGRGECRRGTNKVQKMDLIVFCLPSSKKTLSKKEPCYLRSAAASAPVTAAPTAAPTAVPTAVPTDTVAPTAEIFVGAMYRMMLNEHRSNEEFVDEEDLLKARCLALCCDPFRNYSLRTCGTLRNMRLWSVELCIHASSWFWKQESKQLFFRWLRVLVFLRLCVCSTPSLSHFFQLLPIRGWKVPVVPTAAHLNAPS